MLHFEAENLSLAQKPIGASEEHALMIAVDGAHSAGKTTVIRDYIQDKDLLVDGDIDDFGGTHHYDYPTVCVTEIVDNITVPIVIVGEIARQTDALYPQRNMLTTGYNKDDQASITLRTMSRTQGAGMSALAMARKLQPDREKAIGVVLTDRGVLSGFGYAMLRLPKENHAQANLASISDLATPSFPISIAEQAYAFAADHYDKILLTDHTEVAFEDDGKRVVDDGFRSQVADTIAALYRAHLSPNKVELLHGDRSARVAKLSSHIHGLINLELES